MLFTRLERRINMRLLTRFLGAAIVAAIGFGGAANGKSPAVKESTCGDYGTSIFLEDTPALAAKRAMKEEKLVMVLHVSGHFEDPKLT
jgi:hypothetical protein